MMLWCFHGFLGRGADFDPILGALGENHLGLAPDLFHRDSQPIVDFAAWASRFNEDFLSPTEGPFIGVGYSMGGRLLMNLAHLYPDKWRDIFLFSSSPGWSMTDAEKSERKKWEEDWSEKFLYGDWEEIVEDWNAQEVLQSPTQWQRPQSEFDRAKLAKAIKTWSPTKMELKPQDFMSTPFQIHHWVGEDDLKYKKVQFELLQSGLPWDFQVYAGGHRFPFEYPDMMKHVLQPYLYEPNCAEATSQL